MSHIRGLSAVLALLVGGGAEAAEVPFAPPKCAYSVSFPAVPALSQPAENGDQSADLVLRDTRYAAACLLFPGNGVDAQAWIRQMADGLGVRDASIKPYPELGPGCGDVEGALGPDRNSYRIEARICIAPGSIFIAEAVHRPDLDQSAIHDFFASLTVRPTEGAQ